MFSNLFQRAASLKNSILNGGRLQDPFAQEVLRLNKEIRENGKIDPYDIRMPIAAVMSAQNWVFDRLPKGQKVVMVVGEDHRMHSHMLFQQALIDRLMQQQTAFPDRILAVGIEADHRLGDVKKDIYGKAALDSLIQHCNSVPGQENSKAVFKKLRKLHVPVSLNDITPCRMPGTEMGVIIDQSDPFSKKIVETYSPHLLGQNIPRDAVGTVGDIPFTEGMKLSNAAIVENALEHMRAAHAGVYLQLCGSAHVAGYYDTGLEYQYSLTAMFNQRGCAVVSFVPRQSGYVPDWALEKQSDKILHIDLPENIDGESYATARDKVNHASQMKLI